MSQPTADFLDLPDLACEDVGGAALACNDEFFAARENLLRARPAEWREHEYGDRGKWMDGWETRRRREAGHDWCLIRLGMPGVVRGVVVDTAYFRGNYPESCAIFSCEIDDPLDLRGLDAAIWHQLLPRTALQGDHKNAFGIAAPRRATHLRLEIFPDGGVARLRVHGDVVPDWRRLRALGGSIDLAALENGAWVEQCSDMFFGSRNNLIKPGPSRSMADGWETRRRRGPGNDWALVRLAAPGRVEKVEIDTSHFKGNAPGRCVLEGKGAAGWRVLLSSPLQPHTRHVFDEQLRRTGVVSHVRLSVFPDGGVARLRVWGALEPEAMPGLGRVDALPDDDARAAFLRCCGAQKWATRMVAHRPFEDLAAMLRIGERLWWELEPEDWLEAFAAHPRIGDRTGGSWERGEQRSTADASADTLAELAALNQQYADKFGFIYIVCASGRSADEMLADLRERVGATREVELVTAGEEQAKITRLRLRKLVEELP
jgi:allantoicase